MFRDPCFYVILLAERSGGGGGKAMSGKILK